MSSLAARKRLVLSICLLLAAQSLWSDTDCPKCDCSHFPISDPECVKCCFSEKIEVTSLSNTSVTGKPILPEEKQSDETFQIEKTTRINGKPRTGAAATVYYRVSRGQRIATQVDELAALHGALVPANSPSPPDTCEQLALQFRERGRQIPPIPTDALRIFFGDSEAYSTEQRFIIWKIVGEETLVLQKTESGMFVSAKLRDPDGKVVADIVNNEFFINLQGQYKIERPGQSTLVVHDNQRRLVLDVQFLSPRVIKILGNFFGPNGVNFTIDEKEYAITSKSGGKFIFSHSCFGGGGAGLFELTADGRMLVR